MDAKTIVSPDKMQGSRSTLSVNLKQNLETEIWLVTGTGGCIQQDKSKQRGFDVHEID